MNKAHFFAHLHKVRTHRKWVRHYCSKVGLHWQGLVHDLSKYSPTEFWESVEYYQGNRSPIDACKEEKGYSLAWMHHRGRNKHHREYWTDYYDKGTASIAMPYKYAVEMLCDFLAAGRAYNGLAFTYEEELKWWENQLCKNICIHPQTAKFITLALQRIANGEELSKSLVAQCYGRATSWALAAGYTVECFERSDNFREKL